MMKSNKKANIVIVGSGAAGISLALSLKNYKGEVLLIEGGKEDYSDDSQSLYEGDILRRDLPSGLVGSRSRFFGGSTNCWAGGLGVFDKIDFEYRDWIKNSGWPIFFEDLEPYYKRAARFLDIDYKTINNLGKEKWLNFSGFEYRNLIFTKNTNFKTIFRKDLEKQKNLEIIFSMNLVQLHRGNSRINIASFENYSGDQLDVQADIFVLALGGIENARALLLTAKKDNYQDAIGNHSNHLGRYFSDHPIAPCATFVPLKGKKIKLDINEIEVSSGPGFRPFYKFPDVLQKKYKTLNSCLQFQSQELPLGDAENSAWTINQYITNRSNRTPSIKDVSNVLMNPLTILKKYLQRTGTIDRKSRLAVRFQVEQAPISGNRVILSNDVDSLGLRKVALDFDFTDIERHTVDVAVSFLASRIYDEKIGILKYDQSLIDTLSEKLMPKDLRGGQHHSGTTKMSLMAEGGVVDKNLSVWHYPNLFILGGSCFPSNGWVNPTFTIIAMAMRLSDHLETQVKNL